MAKLCKIFNYEPIDPSPDESDFRAREIILNKALLNMESTKIQQLGIRLLKAQVLSVPWMVPKLKLRLED